MLKRLSRDFKVGAVSGGQWKDHQTFQKWDPISKRLVTVACCLPPKQNPIVPPTPSPPAQNYDWMLIDSDNVVWTTSGGISNLSSTGYSIPLPSGYWKNDQIERCLWTGKYWIFVNGKDGSVLRSDDTFQTWDTVITGVTTSGTDNYDIETDGQNKVVIHGNSFCRISTDNGATWSSITVPSSSYGPTKIYYDNIQWLALIDETTIYRSIDKGLTFSLVFSTSTSEILSLCRIPSNNSFYAVGRYRYWTSSDGITWNENTIGTGINNNLISEVIYDQSKYVAVAPYNGPVWSVDGVNWTTWTTSDGSVLNGYDYDYNRLYYNGGNEYLYRNTDGKIYKSLDGKSWSVLSHPKTSKWFVSASPKQQDVGLNIK